MIGAALSTFFLVLIVTCAVAVLRVRRLLDAVIVFGAFSFFSALFFTGLGALDVAFTEAAVGAAITTVFFVTAIYRTEVEGPDEQPDPSAASARRRRYHLVDRGAAPALVFATAVLFYAGADLPTVGDATSPASTHVSPRYIERGLEETGAPNLVTGVLADYRGFDTLGETTVIFTAGVGCVLILGAFSAPFSRREEP